VPQSASSGAVITVRDLRKTYDGQNYAVDGIDFEVPAGHVLALLGPNGAGKTTTVEILEGYRSRSAGEVDVLGMDPARGGRAYRERIGIVLQECGIEPYLTVKEVLSMRAPLYPHPRAVGEVIDLVGLTEKSKAKVRTLSGGQKRRLDLGLALIGDPELIYLDEPTTGFDPSARRASWDIVRDLCSLGKTVLLTTHYMDEAQALASEVVIMAGGKIVARGAPNEIGGRAHGHVTIEFDLPQGQDPNSLPVAADVEGSVVQVLVNGDEGATEVVHKLTGWALGLGVELEGLTITRPTLEDVYLELTADAQAETVV
jgi:ABC-2 type transport system ATP-binding protein